ncbi:hypothetical protein N9W74_00130 [bacterium]|nr:hypothetical protein [bacterium]
MTSIPAGTQFQGVIPSNGYKNKKSDLLNSLSPLYTIEDIAAASGGGALTVETLTLQGTTAATTSQAIYGINVIDTATTSALATRLPAPTTGKQTTFVNTSSMSILVFPSVTGGEINGVVDGYASIPNDGHPYVFSCVENPLPGAWVWSPPATGQIQLGTISISHTNGTTSFVWSTGQVDSSGNQIIATGMNLSPWYNNLSVSGSSSGGFFTTTFPITTNDQGLTTGEKIWLSAPNLTPARTITAIKVYTNFLTSDTSIPGFAPQIVRYMAYAPTLAGYNNLSASGVYLSPTAPISPPLYNAGLQVTQGPLSSPAEVGDVGTVYSIQPSNTVQFSPSDTDLIGEGPNGLYYHTFVISIPQFLATKTYKFDIFIEHT